MSRLALTLVLLLASWVVTSCGGDAGSGGSVSSPEAGSVALEVESTQITYLPDQSGGPYHQGVVEGQVSVKSGGKLVKSYNPTPTAILPRSRGVLIEEALDLPKPAPDGRLEAKLVGERLNEAKPAPRVKFSDLGYRRKGVLGCSLTGTLRHNLKEPTEIEVNAVGYQGRRIVTSGLTFVDKVFPGSPATFEINVLSDTLCPQRVDRVEAFWDPGPQGLGG